MAVSACPPALGPLVVVQRVATGESRSNIGFHLWNSTTSASLSSDPERSGVGDPPQTEVFHDQVSRSARDCRAARNVCDCPADVCSRRESERGACPGQSRPACGPSGRSRLLQSGLAEFRQVLPARGRLGCRDSRSPSGDRPAVVSENRPRCRSRCVAHKLISGVERKVALNGKWSA